MDEAIKKLAQTWGKDVAPWPSNLSEDFKFPVDVSPNDPLCQLSQDGGMIQKWTLEFWSDGKPRSMRYDMLTNCYCMKIKRKHKSNRIFFEVDFEKRTVRQKCWDVDCRGFVSAAIPNVLHSGCFEKRCQVKENTITGVVKDESIVQKVDKSPKEAKQEKLERPKQ